MFNSVLRRLSLLTATVICAQLIFFSPVQSAPDDSTRVKELNFVFLHGAGGNDCALQLLADSIEEQLPSYISGYEQDNAGTVIRVDTLRRCYPNSVDIGTWAYNIATTLDEHFHDKENLILVGHSMGGKAALYAVAKNIGGLADRVALVVTINSPVKRLSDYTIFGGGPVEQYCRAGWFIADAGVCNSVTYYDSSRDGLWVGGNKHWLAFVSGESAPLSEQFDTGGVDPWPRDMDDGLVPLSAQYIDAADVVYYGEYGHSEFSSLDEVAGFMGERILRYIFGGSIECSVFNRSGTFNHRADWLLGIDHWEDIIGQVPASSGSLQYTNESYTKWQEWEDTVGEYCPAVAERSSYQVSRRSLPVLTDIKESYWVNPDDPEDCLLYIKTRAAPRTSVRVDWSIYQRGLLPAGIERDHYEVEILAGTPLTSITRVSWMTDDADDLMLRIFSEADSPFRWFKAKWRVYSKESRQRQVIDEIP